MDESGNLNGPKEVKQTVFYCIVLIMTYGSPLVVSLVKNVLISSWLGLEVLAVYVDTSNYIVLTSYILIFYVTGLISQISSHLAKEEYEMVGRRINASQILGLILAGIIVVILYFTQDLFLILYNPDDEILKMIKPFYDLYLITVPVILISTINGSILVGLQAMLLRALIEIFASALDVLLLYVFIIHAQLGLNSGIYSYLTARITSEIIQYIYIYQSKHIKKFKLLEPESRNFFEKQFLKGFLEDSGFLVGRGLLMLVQYMVAPMVASRTGTVNLTSYSFMSTLFLYPAVISDAMGITAGVKGAYYLGLGKYSYWKKLVFFIPLVGISVGILFDIMYWSLHNIILSSFTTNNEVVRNMEGAAQAWIVAVAIASLPGPWEGLAMAKLHFPLLFFTILLAITVWGVITAINLVYFNSLTLIFVALAAFMWMRFFPLFVIIITEFYFQRHRPDDVKIQ